MPQLSLYIDRDTLGKIEQRAKQSHTSTSKWVATNIRKFLSDDYPEDYFTLFGSIDDPSFTEPKPASFSNDSMRETL
jgi:hypothetical protein